MCLTRRRLWPNCVEKERDDQVTALHHYLLRSDLSLRLPFLELLGPMLLLRAVEHHCRQPLRRLWPKRERRPERFF